MARTRDRPKTASRTSELASLWRGAAMIVMAFALAGALPAAASPDGPRRAGPTVIETNLTDGQWIDFSPFAFVVQFSEPVRLESTWLVDSRGGLTPLPGAGLEGARISVPMPVLVPHHYRLHYRGRAKSGAAVASYVQFAIRGCEGEAGFTDQAQR